MFDCLKGVIVLSVILFHSYMDVWSAGRYEAAPLLYRLITTFPAPAIGTLFLVSGYGFSPIRKRRSFRNQVKLLLRPCVIVYICAIAVRIPLNLITGQNPLEGAGKRILGLLLGSLSYKSIFGVEVYSILVFWYMIALFLAWLLLSLIFKIFKKTVARTCAVCLCVSVGALLSLWGRTIPFCIVPTLLAIGFLYFGYVMKKQNWLFVKLSWWIYLILAVVSLLILKFGEMNLGTGVMKLGLINYAGMICVCFLILRIYLCLFCSDWKIYTPFMFLGRNSLLILCLHGFEHLVFEWSNYAFLTRLSPQVTAWCLAVVRAVIVVGLFYLIQLLQKIYKKMKKNNMIREEK